MVKELQLMIIQTAIKVKLSRAAMAPVFNLCFEVQTRDLSKRASPAAAQCLPNPECITTG
jgi:hypothetical protein